MNSLTRNFTELFSSVAVLKQLTLLYCLYLLFTSVAVLKTAGLFISVLFTSVAVLKQLTLSYCLYLAVLKQLTFNYRCIEVAVSLAGQTIALPPNNRLAHETIEVCLLQRKQGLRIENIIKKTKKH